MNHIEELTKLFTKFPGIGPRVARRFAYFILRSNAGYVQSLASAMMNIQKNVRLCPVSFAYYFPDGYNTDYSPIILDQSRDHAMMMIVEKETDIEIIEKSNFWNGNYFVLGQLAPLIDTDLEEKIRLPALRDIIRKRAEKMSIFPGSTAGLTEVVLALATHPEGDRTAHIIRTKIADLQSQYGFRITTLGRGFSSGTEIEYSDSDTLSFALKNRSIL